jgi:ribokinase
MDLIAVADRQPKAGESVVGTFTKSPGGKGGNQACQCARAGARTVLLTRLGDDSFGRELLAALAAKGVDTSFVVVDPDAATGASTVFSVHGEYASIIAPGAAAELSIADVERARPALAEADALLLQLELPASLAAHAAERAAAMGKQIILNASPAPADWSAVPANLWRATSVLVVNAVEAGGLLRSTVEAATAGEAAAALSRQLGIATVVITLGAAGSIAWQAGRAIAQPPLPAEVVDTVGAGDAFLGTFAVALAEGLPIEVSLARGAAAGALAVTRRGAYAALPTRAEVDRKLESLLVKS